MIVFAIICAALAIQIGFEASVILGVAGYAGYAWMKHNEGKE